MANFFRAKRIEVFIVVVIIAVFGVVYAFTRAPMNTTNNSADNSTTQQPAAQSTSNDITYDGMDGRNALDLLKTFHQVQTKDTSFGPEVVGIDGVVPDPSNSYWAFYVNGQLSQVGADTYITKAQDKLEWKVEQF
ncbi:MAG TPA: DUF4430 domain-containing protein [Patescibacteria group bacterium]|nr:DUF4430 domain-containing protein [Patescibacteria group bacterium]